MYIKTHLSVHSSICASRAMKIPTCTETSFSIVSTADCHLHSFFFMFMCLPPMYLQRLLHMIKAKTR